MAKYGTAFVTKISEVVHKVYEKHYKNDDRFTEDDIYKMVMCYFKFLRLGIKQPQMPTLRLPFIGKFMPIHYRVRKQGKEIEEQLNDITLSAEEHELKTKRLTILHNVYSRIKPNKK